MHPSIPHFYISKGKLDEYVDLFNNGKNMFVEGVSVEFNTIIKVFISATKLKDKQEIDLYKKKYKIFGDTEFAKNKKDDDICSVITSQLIKTQISKTTESVKTGNSIKELFSNGKVKEDIELGLKNIDTSHTYRNDFVLLKSRLEDLNRSNRKGVIDEGAYNRELNRIKYALLEIIDELED